MADIKITTHSGLIEATIKSKQETYYLVTEDNLNSLKTKSLFNDLFVLLASLAWGTYFSIVITIKSIPQIDPETAKNTIQPLLTLRDVSFFASIVFTLLTALMFYQSFDQIKNIKKGKLELNDPQPNQGQPNQGQQNDGQQNGAQ